MFAEKDCKGLVGEVYLREREGERESHYVHWTSKAYEDESVFMSETHLGWQ